MRIAITHTRYSYMGGIEKYIHSLVERLLEAGHEVHVLTARWEPRGHPRLFFHRVRMLRFPASLRALSFNWFCNRILKRNRFDLVHGFTKTDRQDIYTDGSGTLREFIAATWAERPAWRRRLHELAPDQLAIRWLERRRFRRGAIRRIIPMAAFVRDQLLREYPLEPERVEVIYNGVDVEYFHPRNRLTLGEDFRRRYGIVPGRKVLLFVGNDWQRKGLDTVLAALPAIQHGLAAAHGEPRGGRALLVVAGSDNHAARFREQAARLGVGNDVLWLGPTREIREPFAASDLFLFPSRYDVFGNVGLEALASGVPVVLSARAGVCEVLDDGEAGRVLEDPRDASALAAHALALLSTEDGGVARRAAARAIGERYSWEHHFERLGRIYEQVIAEKRLAEQQAAASTHYATDG